MQSDLFRRSALFCRIRRRSLLSVWAFCLLLLVTVVVAFDRVRSFVVAQRSTHTVELYTYRYPGDPSKLLSSWNDFPEGTNLLVMEDANLESAGGKIIPIGGAHGPGLLHRGLWLAVLREGMNDSHKYEIFLLKRAPSLKTCPGAWGLVGEHSNSGESWDETARRAMREELSLSLLPDDGNYELVNLLPDHSVLVRAPYVEMRRRELQATGLFAVLLSREDANKIQPDEEVADVKWVPIKELETMHMCNKEITDLAKLVAHYLKQQGFE